MQGWRTIGRHGAAGIEAVSHASGGQGSVDLAKVLIGKGNSAAEYQCSDGSQVSAAYEVTADEGPMVVLSKENREAVRLKRHLNSSGYEISQCVTGVSSSEFGGGVFDVLVCYRTPTEIETISVREKIGSKYTQILRCGVRGVRTYQ